MAKRDVECIVLEVEDFAKDDGILGTESLTAIYAKWVREVLASRRLARCWLMKVMRYSRIHSSLYREVEESVNQVQGCAYI